MPFPVRAIQVDGGSEFQAAFEMECQRRGLRLFVLPPRSPKRILPRKDERAQRTHTEEFYEITDFSLEMATLNQELLAWEHTYNTIRPHQLWDTSPHYNSSPAGNANGRRQSVTNLLDEYNHLTTATLACMILSLQYLLPHMLQHDMPEPFALVEGTTEEHRGGR